MESNSGIPVVDQFPLMVNMTTTCTSVGSKNGRTCSREPMACRQKVITPHGLCPLTSRSPDSLQREADTTTGVSMQGDCLRDFESEISPAETNVRNLNVGDRFPVWNCEVEFGERHKTPTQLDPLRQVGDPLADECVAALGTKPGADALAILEQYLCRPICEKGVDAPRKFQDSVLKVPDWVDWDIIRKGQQTYWKHANSIQFVLLHYCLIGGFSASRLSRTLECTSYLTGSPDRCYQRLVETSLMVYDCMHGGIESLQPQTGKGWTSVVRVRLLHSQVRLRILSLAGSHPEYYSVEQHGVPINQEDLVATLGAFSIAVDVALKKIGIHLSPEEVSAYFHVWRLVGHYMGVLPENDPLTSREDALASFESIFYHISQPDESSANVARTVIQAVAERPPFSQSFSFHSAFARVLLGEALSNSLRIETSSFHHRMVVKLVFSFLRWPSTPWWTRRIERWHTWQFKEISRKFDMNFNMKVVPNVS